VTHLGAALAGAAAGGLAAAEAGGESAALGRTAPPAGNPGAGLGPPTAPAGLGPCRRLYNATSTMQLVPTRQGWGGGAVFLCELDNVEQAMGGLHDACQHLHLPKETERIAADAWS